MQVLETESVVDWPAQISTGPAGVSTGVTGSGVTLTVTLLLLAEVPQELVEVTV